MNTDLCEVSVTDPATERNLPAAPEGAGILAMIERIALQPDIPVDRLERLLDMQERISAKTAEAEFNQALCAAQSEMGRISADALNPQTRSKYASYGQLDRHLRPIYTRHGFALSFDTGEHTPDMVRVICHVSHRAGHSRTHHVDMPADGKGAKGNDVMTKTHASGAAMTYGQRYLLKLIFNVAIGEDDNDGNGPKGQIEDAAKPAAKLPPPPASAFDRKGAIECIQRVKSQVVPPIEDGQLTAIMAKLTNSNQLDWRQMSDRRLEWATGDDGWGQILKEYEAMNSDPE